MWIFFSFCETELGFAMLGHPRAQSVGNVALWESGGEVGVMGFGVTHHPQLHRQFDPWTRVKLCEIWLAEGRQNLAGPVGAEVEAKEAVLRLQPSIIPDHACGNELVGLTPCIGLRDHLLRGGGFWTLCLCDGCECSFNPLPTVIAI